MAKDLLQKALAAHGGLDRWNSFETVQATIVTGGQLFGMKGTPQDATPRRMTVSTRREWASVIPFGADDQRTNFTANRIAIEKVDGTLSTKRRAYMRNDRCLPMHDRLMVSIDLFNISFS